MTSSQLKFYQLFSEFAKTDLSDKQALTKCFKDFLALDFNRATEVWDYLLTTREEELSNPDTAMLYVDSLYQLFKQKSAPKTTRTILDVPSVRRGVFQYCPNINEGDYFNLIVDLLVMNKIADAEDVFKCAIKNTCVPDGFGGYMKKINERLFIEILKRSDTKRVEMSRKLSQLLLTYIAKIKTDERAMLEQRIKELN